MRPGFIKDGTGHLCDAIGPVRIWDDDSVADSGGRATTGLKFHVNSLMIFPHFTMTII